MNFPVEPPARGRARELSNKSSRVPVYVEIVKMKTKSAITALLLAFVIVSVGYLVFQQFGKQEQPAAPEGQAAVSAAAAAGKAEADNSASPGPE